MEGGTDRLRAGEPGGDIDRGAKRQRDHWSDARRRHQPAADLIVTHDLKQLAVKHAELLAQDPAAISSGSTIAAKSYGPDGPACIKRDPATGNVTVEEYCMLGRCIAAAGFSF